MESRFIQGLRTAEGKTRFQHRQSIYLSSELPVPNGAALLEDWLMGMRSAINRPKDVSNERMRSADSNCPSNEIWRTPLEAVDELGSLSQQVADISQRLANWSSIVDARELVLPHGKRFACC